MAFISTIREKLERVLIPKKTTKKTCSSLERNAGDYYHDPIDIDEWILGDEEELLHSPRSGGGELDSMQVEESYIEIDSDGDSELSSELKSDISADKSEGKTGDNTNTVLAVTISVMAEEGDCFEGADLIREFTAAGLELGKTKLYHAYADSEDGKQERTLLFTVSNILMPGIFEQSSILDLKTTGIALFFQLPREHSGKLSFESMSEIAYQLSRGLGGVVCDGARRELKPYALQRLRDQVYEFEYNQELERRRAEISD